MQGTGLTYLFVTPLSGNGFSARSAFTIAGPPGERQVNATAVFPATVQTHMAVVIDGTTKFMSFYINGMLAGQVSLPTATLSSLPDVNNWLGRSQFGADPEFSGSITEFRIYSRARTAMEIGASAMAGPTALPAM